MRRARRTPNRCHSLVVAVFVAGIPCGARAAGGSTSQGAAAARAESAPTLVLRGVKLYKEHRYDAARDAFDQAYKLDPQPGTLLNLALSELKADQPVEAAAHFREYLKALHEPEAKLDSVRTTYLPLAESVTAQLDIHTSIAVEVLVDGVALSATTVASERAAENGRIVSVRVRAGEHGVTVRQGTYEQTQRVTAKGGEILDLHLEQVQSEAPRPELSVPSIETPTSLPGDDSGRERTKWITVVSLGAGAVAIAGLGVGFAVGARNQASDASAATAKVDPNGSRSICFGPAGGSSWCTRLNDETQAAKRNWAISLAFYVGAGVLGAASLITWTLWPSTAATRAGARLTPVVTARSGGFVLDTEW